MTKRLYEGMKILQAPMCSTTDLPFRILTRRIGLKFAFTEMLAAKPILLKSAKTFEYMKTCELDRPLGTQVLGRDPDMMAEAFSWLEAQNIFEVIDINMGCPVPKIVKKGLGCALMNEPKQFEAMLSKITKSVKVPVTVKFRTGWDRNSRNAVEIAKIAEACGAQAVTIHGRTRSQMYSGEIDFEIIRKAKEGVNIPVIGNGGLFSKKDCDEMFQKTGCDLVMVSRGSNGNPWIFKDVETGIEHHDSKILTNVKDTVLEHAKLVKEYHGADRCGHLLRRVGSYYFKGFPGSSEYKQEIHKANSYEEFVEAVLAYTNRLENEGITTAQTLPKAG